MAISNDIILVNERDEVIGSAEKLETHQQGWLHRAFSIMLYRRQAGQLEFLLQQRAAHKYHCGGLWTNTCCSHPRPEEAIALAAKRRLYEELGLSLDLHKIGSFTYRAQFNNGLTEHEFDHVFIAEYTGMPAQFNREEISMLKWIKAETLQEDLQAVPSHFTPWLFYVVDLCLAKL